MNTDELNAELHQLQDDAGYFDEPWWLDLEPSAEEVGWIFERARLAS